MATEQAKQYVPLTCHGHSRPVMHISYSKVVGNPSAEVMMDMFSVLCYVTDWSYCWLQLFNKPGKTVEIFTKCDKPCSPLFLCFLKVLD